MSDSVLHATWLPAAQRLFMWGESVEVPRRKGRQPRIPRHPYQSAPETISERLDQLALKQADAAEHPQTIWLPSANGSPLPSPELLEMGASLPEAEHVELAPWQVTGLLLPVDAALDLLLALSSAQATGADLQAWRVAALVAMRLIARQQVVPVLQRDGFHLRARWQPRLDPETAQTVALLSRSLPPICRAAVDDPASAPAPRALLDDFLAAAVDATIRAIALKTTLPTTTPGGTWLRALLGADPILKLSGPAADDLFKSWQAWAGQGNVAGDEQFRITFRLEPPDDEADPWLLTYLLQATDDPSLLVPAASIWREQGQTYTYLERRFEQPQERLLTGLGYAARVFPPIEASLRQAAPERAVLSATKAFSFLKEAVPLLEQSGFGVLIPAWWQGRGARIQARARAKSTAPKPNEKGVLSFERLVSFDWELSIGGEPLDRSEFERLVELKLPLVQVRGQWIALDPEHIDRVLRLFEQGGGTLTLGEALRMGLGADGAVTPQGVEFAGLEAEGWLHDLLATLSDLQRLEPQPEPRQFHGTLRPYQSRGFSWMAFLRQFGLGACLADDMGLGKTAQTLALLLHERERLNVTAPALIVCPTSVIGNWLRELQRFAPALRVMIHQGADRRQGEAFERAAAEHDVVLTSFPLLARDRETLTSVGWDSVVLDEAQNIKNASAKQAQAARALTARHRVALTGTPVENRLTELWSIMTFLNPGYLGSEAAFRREFARPIERTADPQATERLRKLTTPFVLRRLKTDPAIISDLPEKLEMNVYCTLTPEQATLYEAVVQDALEQINQAEQDENAIQRRGQVLAMLMQLKQVCNHPAQFLKDGSPLPGRSGKLARLVEMLEEVYAEGDRALIFTQFAEMGAMLQSHLSAAFFDDVLFLHGGTHIKERDGMVRRFQAPKGPRVFILSLKAGGTGLNLTAANHVFHFDRWWNPAVENQATDRAFRIGQRRNVQVHKFICGGTLEEHIDELIESKRALAESVLGGGESWLTELNTDQLRDLVALRRADVVEA
ncbi:MAG TPA: DEAD/DEAH box helicase [Herpetosiphonaceae bacterium]